MLYCLIFTAVAAQQQDNIQLFDQIIEQVKILKKTDLTSSLKQLTVFENQLSALTIEQNLLYFKLLCEIQIAQNKYSAAKETANQGLNITKQLASPSLIISELLYLKGFAFESLGDLNQAAKEYKKGLEVAESLHSKVQIAAGLINLGTIAYLRDDLKRALILLNDAYNIAGKTDDEKIKGTANSVLGILYSHLQQDEQSMAYYQQSYLHFKAAGMLLSAHNSLHNIASKHASNKNYAQAINVFKQLIAESNKDTTNDSMFAVYSGLAWAYIKQDKSNPEAAYQYLLKAKEHLQFTEKIDDKLKFYIDEAYILAELKRFDEALGSIETVIKILALRPDMSKANKEDYLRMIALNANVFYQQKKFKQAYDTQSQLIFLTDKVYENEDNSSITQVRLKLEAEQADKQNKLLYNEQALYEASLNEVNLENKIQRHYLIISALVALAFAWVLVKLIQSQQRLKIASNIDALTGVANRRSLMNKSQEAFELAKMQANPLSILMIDVDHFKNINDSLGHNVGDKVLKQLALLSSSMMRKSDIFGRFGGEEFMICLPKTNFKSAMDIGERIRTCINEYSWQIKTIDKVTVSIGVACLADESDLVSLIKKADEQLYKAKESGRDKVCGDDLY
ncbi:tetratricopeptide repeat-containing diguanylate cyclase [Colwellia echini]|uniref:tetratricopeptide repeat-containing diguanylate cyclase n=1 Tax=Colwellia echini TaxID=1982103 RepID=UPI001FE3650A|nr:tetratricopeptide repeat-containing diguanylate cyclase [Colwellia echini]